MESTPFIALAALENDPSPWATMRVVGIKAHAFDLLTEKDSQHTIETALATALMMDTSFQGV
ncbi:hypothetical protein D9B85_05910 [Corynebacterium diphtheriae]|uniref:hypothetical protein n=1 Tax=Corynebacterium diphtheriae TaxID=1717 RepID=UPI0002467F6A|nr:hypothetical protein [Corynebacterium diphtheriae]AEX67338.1 hypothetical protein CDC7B_1142 [Corynebacterium diphtheriae C7 (beta)]MBG9277513.1 hypothetical protein [Corynebacterium diphtheriae bv. mitis]MBG9281996.1 hypothetical protein [Corynebacterium diphtheriae bv. mitis]MBG9296506.1 hypothetical protein [Corynebacterium diphtheriae bv. gravis]MBG9335703.1 hypothetical protein [Corynebacterium diphtheriae bv. gravis]